VAALLVIRVWHANFALVLRLLIEVIHCSSPMGHGSHAFIAATTPNSIITEQPSGHSRLYKAFSGVPALLLLVLMPLMCSLMPLLAHQNCSPAIACRTAAHQAPHP